MLVGLRVGRVRYTTWFKRYFLISMVLYMSDSMVAVYELYLVKNKLSLIETTVDEKQTVALFPTWSQPVFALAP